MTRTSRTLRLFVPFVAMALLLCILLLERRGVSFEAQGAMLEMYAPEATWTPRASVYQQDAPLMIAYLSEDESEASYVETLQDVLNMMQIPYSTIDLSLEPLPVLDDLNTLILCSRFLHPIQPHVERLVEWIEAGGHFGMAMTPDMSSPFLSMYRIFGITEHMGDYVRYENCRFETNLLPLMQGFTFGENGELMDDTLPLRLEADCIIHMASANEEHLPLMWERPMGEGRIVVNNTTLLSGKDARGLVLAMLYALEDTMVYPIINASMIYIDDFPAPQPEGYDDRLLESHGYDIKGFFRHVWWPEMKELAYKYELAYTGVLIETYNDKIHPPFEPEEEATLLRFFASEILHSGGEIGLHGYNHMPLCLVGFPYDSEVNYIHWETEDEMKESIDELYRYGKELFPDADFLTYVPPSNYLSVEGQRVLLEAVPELRVISGLYLYEEGVPALTQEFQEEPDGTVSVPRITSGFIPDDYNWLVLSQELAFHGVFSHFIHPDDVLDDKRGASAGWMEMFSAFVNMIDSISSSYPELRFMTSMEGAAAVQRYDRLGVVRQETEDGLLITLENYDGDAWLALYTREKPAEVEGAILHPITDKLSWLEVQAPSVLVRWED